MFLGFILQPESSRNGRLTLKYDKIYDKIISCSKYLRNVQYSFFLKFFINGGKEVGGHFAPSAVLSQSTLCILQDTILIIGYG